MRVAILYDKTEKIHSTNWCFAWEQYCNENNINYRVVNPYKIGVINSLMDFDIILWHYSNYSYKDMLMARNILNTLEYHNKKIFPNNNDSWHFDNKLAETYLLESIKAPIPKSFYYYSINDLKNDLKNNDISFPIIAKLRNGSGSHNVKKIDSAKELLSYGKRMFNSGVSSAPDILHKTISNVQSSRSIKTFVKRAKRIPEFLKSLSNAKKFNIERGYVYLQEFIPNDGYDLKVVVVGDKLSFIGRQVNKGEFRASGAGNLFYTRDSVTKEIIDSAFKISDELGFNCMGYDYVVNNNNGQGILIEISYGFSHKALLDANGYFDRFGIWHDKRLNAPHELLKNIIESNE